ncbi:MarR family EPS-associated transcriptional regulator [Roseateles chitosanitabidus]|uniref:MarR family EPS-associated transcriptional regulator n=1 Tax=Roseateles chitosanitabidus TaxID=65048 RepID=UPI0009FC01EF|nr:MarR family EPS-associated transcriptional regulator [Roseateles chitosanitabidus]
MTSNDPTTSGRDPEPGRALDYELLSQLEQKNDSNQRDLAMRMGVSVGKINYCLRAVIDRGWVKVNNFRRSDNKLAYVYILTPSGVHAKMRMARRFLAIKEAEFEQLQREIDALRDEVSRQGPSSATAGPIHQVAPDATSHDGRA